MNWLRGVLPTASMLAILVGIYWFTYLPTKGHQDALKDQIIALKMDVAGLRSRVASLANLGPEQEFPRELVWAFESKTDAELALQDSVVDLAGLYEITLITFGGSSLSRDTAQDTIAFEFEAEGPLGQIYVFLSELEKLNPKTAIGQLTMRPAQSYGNEGIEDVLIYTHITLWGFWGDIS